MAFNGIFSSKIHLKIRCTLLDIHRYFHHYTAIFYQLLDKNFNNPNNQIILYLIINFQ